MSDDESITVCAPMSYFASKWGKTGFGLSLKDARIDRAQRYAAAVRARKGMVVRRVVA